MGRSVETAGEKAMTVYILENAPQKLRGILSRYCLEVRAGLFVGRLDARMRELLWKKVGQLAKQKTTGVMVWRTSNAQGYAFQTIGTGNREPVQMDGLWLIGEQPTMPDISTIEIVNTTRTKQPDH